MPIDKNTVADESAGKTETDSGEGDWISGYNASSAESANAPNYPGNQVWQGVGGSAVSYKAHWKNKQPIFPYGSNTQGGK